MKLLNVALYVGLLSFFITSAVYAQDGGTPDVLVSFEVMLFAVIAAFPGLLGNIFGDLWKLLPWVPEADRSRIQKSFIDLVVAIASMGAALLVAYVGKLLGYEVGNEELGVMVLSSPLWARVLWMLKKISLKKSSH